MALATLAELKTSLGISGTSDDDALKHLIRQANSRIRRYCNRWLMGRVESMTDASAPVITSYGHGLKTGDYVKIVNSATANDTDIDGDYQITVTGRDTFTFTASGATANGSGFSQMLYAKRFTEFYSGNGTMWLDLKEFPVLEVEEIYEDSGGYFGTPSGSFASGDLLVEGTDYSPQYERASYIPAGRILKINATWGRKDARSRGLLVNTPVSGLGNIKVQYYAGYDCVQYDLSTAVELFVATLIRDSKKGGPMQSESLDYYSYTRMSRADEDAALNSVKSYLAPYRKWVI